MWKDLIVDIQNELSEYGLALRKPATNQEIKILQEEVISKFNGFTLPDEYIQFLTTVNGLDFNGLVIYGVDKKLLETKVEEEVHGFIESNEIWYENEWQKQYVFFGDSDIALYCYDLNQKVYLELDKPSCTIMNTFPDFNLMLEDALKIRLE
ncbi:YrhA family protein [Halalkalibacterium halodurans]|uniref:YrhA family protein n=1 Tax=Halalkalibacterium halodurans TaxID=86665 RepID=UPI002AA9CAC6|nr:YrhA family protein [Halalkalibacterium halodurans]MDY7224507.1 YrhA family protein [Halalkalibacterium halodurans]MDY7243792.1 YrhA family protein [Halalkalibacterium halodurans]